MIDAIAVSTHEVEGAEDIDADGRVEAETVGTDGGVVGLGKSVR